MHERARQLNAAGIRHGGEYVLYWCQMNRRADTNQALDFAVELANELALPVLFYEGLTCSYPHASDRFHRFILEGVPETERRLAARHNASVAPKLDVAFFAVDAVCTVPMACFEKCEYAAYTIRRRSTNCCCASRSTTQ